MAIVGGDAEERELNMPDDILRENVGVWLSVFGFLYGILATVVGFVGKRLNKLRDHDEAIRHLADAQSQTAEILACLRAEHSAETKERREEDARIYARLEANCARYDQKVDEIKESLHQIGLKVERAILRTRTHEEG